MLFRQFQDLPRDSNKKMWICFFCINSLLQLLTASFVLLTERVVVRTLNRRCSHPPILKMFLGCAVRPQLVSRPSSLPFISDFFAFIRSGSGCLRVKILGCSARMTTLMSKLLPSWFAAYARRAGCIVGFSYCHFMRTQSGLIISPIYIYSSKCSIWCGVSYLSSCNLHLCRKGILGCLVLGQPAFAVRDGPSTSFILFFP